MADGKLNGQKAFMSGKLKVKGNIMLATSAYRYRNRSFAEMVLKGLLLNMYSDDSCISFFTELDGVLKAQKAKL